MDNIRRRESLRNRAAMAVPVAADQMASFSPNDCQLAPPTGRLGAQINDNNMLASFSRGIDITGLQSKLKAFWVPRMAKVKPYVVTKGAGRPNGNDDAAIVMQFIRPFLEDFSIYHALCVLDVMSKTPDLAGNWNVTYSTFRKRSHARDLHSAYYKEVAIKKVTWTTANLKYALDEANWEKHMSMLAEVAVAVQAAYGINVVEIACKALEILDTISPTAVQTMAASLGKSPAKQEKKKKQQGKKRSATTAGLDTVVVVAKADAAVPPPTRNLRPRKDTKCTSEIKEHIEVKLEPTPTKRKPVKKAVRATTTTATVAAPPAAAPFFIDTTTSMVMFLNNEAEEEAQVVMDEALAGDSEDILLYFDDPLFLLVLDELKVHEIKEEPAAEVKQEPQQQQKQQQKTLQQLQLPDMLPEVRLGDCF